MAVNIQDLAAVYGALGDPTRLRILALLGDGEVCVCHMHEALRLPQPTVSRHLAYLRRTGLVEARRDGLWVYYGLARLADTSVRAAVEAAIHAVGHVASSRTDHQRLAREVPRPSTPRRFPVVPCCGPAVQE